MSINKNRFRFRFWPRLLGTSIVLFLLSLTQEYLDSAKLFVMMTIFLGSISIVAMDVGTNLSGFQKFLSTFGFILLVALSASLMLWGFCKVNEFSLCTARPFGSTVAAFFIIPLFSWLFYLLAKIFASFFKHRYHV
jgi:hypothetical protein